MKIRLMTARFFYANRATERHDKLIRVLAIRNFANAPKTGVFGGRGAGEANALYRTLFRHFPLNTSIFLNCAWTIIC